MLQASLRRRPSAAFFFAFLAVAFLTYFLASFLATFLPPLLLLLLFFDGEVIATFVVVDASLPLFFT